MQVGWDRGIFNPIHRTAHRLLTSFAQDCVCPRSHHFVVCWLRDIDTIDVKLETCLPTLTIWRQIRKTMHLTSVLQWYLIWRHIIVAVRRTQTAIFFNFLGHKNEVYRKLKPLQEKVKYTFFSKLYYRVSRKKISSKNQPSYRHGGLEKGSLFDYKNGRYEKIRIFLAKRDVQPGAHWYWGQ